MNDDGVKRELKRKVEQYQQLVRQMETSHTTLSELMREHVDWLERQLNDLEA